LTLPHVPLEQLVQSFPTLRSAPGASSWYPEDFLVWLCGPAPGSGALHAGRFILEVASRTHGTDWARVARSEGLKGFEEVVKPFALHEAMGVWDRNHVAVVAEYMGAPGVVKPSPLDDNQAREELRAFHGNQTVTESTATGSYTGEKWLVAGVRMELKQQEERRARWPRNTREAMSVLAASFPSLTGAPGLAPWDTDTFLPWLCTQERPDTTSAGLFLLGVWNAHTDWQEVAQEMGLELRVGGRFNLLSALETWDEQHRSAAVAWMDAPFWP
jgi:hypothetical protein